MGNSLAGKVAVVTGSGRGIGRETALMLAQHGAKVVINDLGTASDGTGAETAVAEQVAAEIRANGGEAVANTSSVANSEEADSIIQSAIDAYGRLDILVNNAGILRDRMIWNMSDEEWDAVIKVHLYGHFYCSRAAIRFMRDAIRDGRQARGRIINFTSGSGLQGSAGQSNYSAAKMGIVGFTYSLALACERMGITVNAIAPMAITRLTDTIPDDRLRAVVKLRGMAAADAENIDEVKKALLGGPPAGVAPLVAWLAHDEAQHVNGQVFLMTEGKVALFNHIEESKIGYADGIFSMEQLDRAMQWLTPKPAEG